VKALIKDREQRVWRFEVEQKSKLRWYAKLKTKLEFELYLEHDNPESRKLLSMLRGGTNRLRVETGRWTNIPVEQRTCLICLERDQVEDEAHFLLDCGVYNVVRERMFEEIFQRTGHHVDVRLMKDNREWMMDTLIGHGLIKYRIEVLKAVMRYVVRASRIRRQYSGEKEVE